MTTKQAACQHHWRCLDSKATTKAVCLKCGARQTIVPRYLTYNKTQDLTAAARHYRSDNAAEIRIAEEAMR